MIQMRRTRGAVVIGVGMVLLIGPACSHQDSDIVTITIFHTTDEHGHLLPQVPTGSDRTHGGAANLLAWLSDFEGYDSDEHILLSGGDNWTGASISTWFEGAPTVQAFNAIGYDAAAIGNHDFDFGRTEMEQRFAEAEYPYLSANIRYAESGEQVEFAEPYTMLHANGVSVGIVGLTARSTPVTTHPRNVSDLEFTPYVEVLERLVPRMRQQGAEVIVVLGHVCADELVEVARSKPGLADLMLAGHCHERFSEVVNGTPVISSGSRLRSYTRIDLLYDSIIHQVVDVDSDIERVNYDTEAGNPVEPDAELARLIAEWQEEADSLLSERIGYTVTGVERRSPIMGNWVADAWLWAYPHADIALTNWPGFRAAVDSGPITIDDIVGMMPFDNRLIEFAITGADLVANLLCCGGAVGGMTYTANGDVELNATGQFHPDSTYYVLVNDFIGTGGAGYLFHQQGLENYDTSINWRQPVIDYTRFLQTSERRPLEDLVDPAARTPRGR